MPRKKLSKKGARDKGHSFERKVSEFFRDCGFPDAKRHLEVQAQEAMGYDIDGTGRYRVQCKSLAGSINPLTALSEIRAPGLKVAAIKRTGKGWFVALSPEAAFQLFSLAAKEEKIDSVNR